MKHKLEYVHDNPEFYFTQRARNGGYICPVCGNGSGKDGTGVELIRGQTFRYKCFKCGTSGDVINFYAAEHHITNTDAISQVFKMYGLDTVEKNISASKVVAEQSETIELAEELKVANIIAEDIAMATEHLNETNYFSKRGISNEVAVRCNCGFIKSWTHPKKRGEEKIIPSDRVIIPTSGESYVARAVDEDNRIPKMKAGASNIFNVEVLKTSQQNVVIVEGEFDALSVIEAGNDSVALGSTTNVDKFLSWLKENNVVPKKPLIIDLDNDSAGKTAMKNGNDHLYGSTMRLLRL